MAGVNKSFQGSRPKRLCAWLQPSTFSSVASGSLPMIQKIVNTDSVSKLAWPATGGQINGAGTGVAATIFANAVIDFLARVVPVGGAPLHPPHPVRPLEGDTGVDTIDVP